MVDSPHSQPPPRPPIRPVSLPAGSFVDSDEQLKAYLALTLHSLERYVARHGHRMLQANGTLNDLFVSVQEARMVLEQVAKPADPSEPRDWVSQRMGWPSLADTQQTVNEHLEGIERRRARESLQSAAQRLPLESLRELFRLSPLQTRLLVAAAAPSISVDLARLYAFAWADFALKKPSVGFLTELVSDKEDGSDLVREFRGESALIRYRLLELEPTQPWGIHTPLLHQSVRVSDRIVAFLQNHPEPLPLRIADTCRHIAPSEAMALSRLVLENKTVSELRVALTQAVHDSRGRPRLMLIGPPGTGRVTSCASLLAELNWGTVTVDLARLAQEGDRFEGSLVEICREALLRRSLLVIRGDGVLLDREAMARVGRAMSRVLERYEGPIALTATKRAPVVHKLLTEVFELEYPLPSSAEQRQLWKRTIAEAGCSVSDHLAAALTERFSVTPGAIHQAVYEARARVKLFAREGEQLQLRVLDLASAIRRRTDHVLGSIAEPFTTSLTMDDVVLSEKLQDSIKEILAHARHRETVYETWGFAQKVPYGRGLSCLFSGPPGTGKTMMAAILAKELGRELYRVDISRIVSKWIGETEKNLSLAFDEAERGQLMLLFDEADSLFSKRTKTKSSNDRFANMEINFLLQRMENFDGITILTTNKEKGIDEAFKRRLKFKLNFPMPEPGLRTLLWRAMLPTQVRVEGDIAFDYLGRQFELAGGHIKNAVVRAAFRAAEGAGVITHELLYQAAVSEAREMGMVVREERE